MNAARLKTSVCSPAVLMGITNGCRSEMRLTGRGGKMTRDEWEHTYLLFSNMLKGAAVGRKHWENTDPVTALKRMQGLHGNGRWDGLPTGRDLISVNKHFDVPTNLNHSLLDLQVTNRSHLGLKSQTPNITFQTLLTPQIMWFDELSDHIYDFSTCEQ